MSSAKSRSDTATAEDVQDCVPTCGLMTKLWELSGMVWHISKCSPPPVLTVMVLECPLAVLQVID